MRDCMNLIPPSPVAAAMRGVGVVLILLASSAGLSAQELEPRRWGHLPLGANFAGFGYIRTEGDIALDPVLRLTDVEVELDTAALKYIHSFGLLGKSARFDLVQAYQNSYPPATILQYATYTHSRARKSFASIALQAERFRRGLSEQALVFHRESPEFPEAAG